MPRKLAGIKTKFPSYLVVLTNLSVIVTALIGFMTLRQMKAQTEASYRPDLVMQLPKQDFILKPNKMPCCNFLPIMLSDSETDSTYDRHLLALPEFEIINVGFGAARFVEMNWQFDGAYFLRANDLKTGGAGLGLQELPDKSIQINQNTMIAPFHAMELPYILPIQNGNEAQRFPLSQFYAIGWSSIAYQLATDTLSQKAKMAKVHEVLTNMPPLVLVVSYVDIGGEKHTKNFQFQWSAVVINPSDKEVRLMLNVAELSPGQTPAIKPYESTLVVSESKWIELSIGKEEKR